MLSEGTNFITKSMRLNGGGVLVSGLSVGSLVISASTTVAEFSAAVIANNAGWQVGDQLTFFLGRLTVERGVGCGVHLGGECAGECAGHERGADYSGRCGRYLFERYGGTLYAATAGILTALPAQRGFSPFFCGRPAI